MAAFAKSWRRGDAPNKSGCPKNCNRAMIDTGSGRLDARCGCDFGSSSRKARFPARSSFLSTAHGRRRSVMPATPFQCPSHSSAG
jgi:hypothetical protein